jgi:ATP-dependent RNA helicase DeaD
MTILDDKRAFADLGLEPRLLAVLSELGYEEPTGIQREAIPPLLEGRDLLGQAATGTGKTAAFALPLLQRLAAEGPAGGPMGLVLVPTRELAMQVSEAMYRYGRGVGARVLPVYGGQPIGRQLGALRRGVDVVIATPGRALDHIARGTLALASVRVVVLDEADEMLDMGFAEDIETILARAPAERQTVLFAATMPPRIAAIARKHLRDAVQIKIGGKQVARGELPKVRQTAYVVPRAHKAAALVRILDVEAPAAAIVFCRTRVEVDEITQGLAGRGYRAEALHGGMTQEQRDRVMGRLRGGATELLVATDVAARGLDIEQLTHVVNYEVPSSPEAYVHRIGRVGRAGREGVAITLCEPREHRLLRNMEQLTKQRIHVERVPTVADLRARRLDVTRATLRECLLEGDLESYRVVVEPLTDEFDVMEIALAAVKLADEHNRGGSEEQEIPEALPAREREARERHARQRRRPDREARPPRQEREPRPSSQSTWPPPRQERQSQPPPQQHRTAPAPQERETRERRRPAPRERQRDPSMTRVFIGAGRQAGVRPQDLVGAIANEAHISGREIGAIEIADRFSLVEVAADVAQAVIGALRETTLKGRKVTVRRERSER